MINKNVVLSVFIIFSSLSYAAQKELKENAESGGMRIMNLNYSNSTVKRFEDGIAIKCGDKLILVESPFVFDGLSKLTDEQIKLHLIRHNILLKQFNNTKEIYYTLSESPHGLGGNYWVKYLIKTAIAIFFKSEAEKLAKHLDNRRAEGKTNDKKTVMDYVQHIYDTVLYDGICVAAIKYVESLEFVTDDVESAAQLKAALENHKANVRDEVIMQIAERYNSYKQEHKATPVGYAWASRMPGTPEYNEIISQAAKYGRTPAQMAKWLQ